jgi:hypothetical protein
MNMYIFIDLVPTTCVFMWVYVGMYVDMCALVCHKCIRINMSIHM